MKKAGLQLIADATAVQGPRGLSIKELRFKETLSNGDNVYQVILENNTIIGEITAKKGDKGNKGDTGQTGNGIKSIEKIFFNDDIQTFRITFTAGNFFDFSVQNGENAYNIAQDNGFIGTEEEWLESLIGKGLEFNWKGTELGIRVEGETEYKYVNLKGQTGDRGPQGATGKNLEFTWRGTELGVRVQGESNYQYVDLKGDNGEVENIKFEDIINNWKIVTKYIGNTSTSTNFNSITANGTYYSNVYNSLFTNGFLGANQQAYQEFKLIVIGLNNNGAPTLKSQLVITRDDNIYLRSCTAWQEPWTWSEWKKIARTNEVVSKTGDAMSGNLECPSLSVKNSKNAALRIYKTGDSNLKGFVGYEISTDSIQIGYGESNNYIKIFKNSTQFTAPNLNTNGNLTVTGNQIVNGSSSCKTLILNGWEVSVTD